MYRFSPYSNFILWFCFAFLFSFHAEKWNECVYLQLTVSCGFLVSSLFEHRKEYVSFLYKHVIPCKLIRIVISCIRNCKICIYCYNSPRWCKTHPNGILKKIIDNWSLVFPAKWLIVDGLMWACLSVHIVHCPYWYTNTLF